MDRMPKWEMKTRTITQTAAQRFYPVNPVHPVWEIRIPKSELRKFSGTIRPYSNFLEPGKIRQNRQIHFYGTIRTYLNSAKVGKTRKTR